MSDDAVGRFRYLPVPDFPAYRVRDDGVPCV